MKKWAEQSGALATRAVGGLSTKGAGPSLYHYLRSGAL